MSSKTIIQLFLILFSVYNFARLSIVSWTLKYKIKIFQESDLKKVKL